MMFMSASTTLTADYPVTDLALLGNQYRHAFDGEIVVWDDGADINWLSLSDPDKIQHAIAVSGVQDYAAAGGGRIVWRDKNTDNDIGIYDLELGTNWILSSDDGAVQRYPKVSADYILCENYSGEFYNAAIYDEATDAFVLIAPGSPLQTNLAIDGNHVVWRDDRDGKRQIYLCDLSVTPYVASAVYPDGGDQQWRPAISGDLIVWEDHTNELDVNLVAWSISAGAVVWECDDPTVQANPSVSNGLIVWQDNRQDAPGNADIRGYDYNTGAWLEIATGTENDQAPIVSGRTVVWQQNAELVMTEIPTPTVLAVTQPAGGEQLLADKGELLIAWAMIEGTLPEEVKLEFSADAGDSWDVIEPNVPADAAYRWAPVADVHSPQCQIRVSIFGDESVDAVSEPFTIFQCDTALTADLTGDCVVGLDDFAAFAAQWLTCGNPYDENWCY
jgi:beta propeller repeat protein